MTLSRVLASVLICVPAGLAAQNPVNQRIQARDGDLIVVTAGDTVRIVHRREGQVRALFGPEARWLILLIDHATAGTPPDGRVDRTYSFYSLPADWPLGPRWEGQATIEEYFLAGEVASYGVGLITPAGLIQLMKRPSEAHFRNAAASAVLDFGVLFHDTAMNLPMDAAEGRAVAQASRRASPSFQSVPGATTAGGMQPIRVGGTIKTPLKLHDVRPAYPQEALAARVTGMVILEATIGTDGSVTDARVLKSVPLLDDAAVTAVRQWRFEPTLLNGVPVPVIMTVTVSFNLQ